MRVHHVHVRFDIRSPRQRQKLNLLPIPQLYSGRVCRPIVLRVRHVYVCFVTEHPTEPNGGGVFWREKRRHAC